MFWNKFPHPTLPHTQTHYLEYWSWPPPFLEGPLALKCRVLVMPLPSLRLFLLQIAIRPLPTPFPQLNPSGVQVSSLWVGLCVMCEFLLLFRVYLFQKAIKMDWIGTDGLMGILAFLWQKTGFFLNSFRKEKKMGIFALQEGSGQALCDGGGGVECLHDILYHKIDRMFITDVSYLPPSPHK